jgi:NADPH:quinone reductase-like Zn-dependent oxidoreductase
MRSRSAGNSGDSSIGYAIPEYMRAAVIRQHGGPEVLRLEQVPTPRPGPGEILLRVDATGLNHLDVFMREGLSGPGLRPIHLPLVTGVDVAGVVAAYGSGVDALVTPPVGTRVLLNSSVGCGSCRFCRRGQLTMCKCYSIIGEDTWGGLAEYLVAPGRNVIPIPDHISSVMAAAVPAAFTTAWNAVVTTARVKPSDRVLVVGASGGVGSAQVQIAVACGALVAGTAGSEEKRRKVLEIGADAVFDSHGEWEPDVLHWTGGDGVNAAFDAVGAPTMRRSLRCLAMGGKLVISGATGGDTPDLSIREIYQSHRQILGAPMGTWEDFIQVTGLVWRGVLRPHIHAVYPLEQIAEAEREIERRRHFGKIVVQVAEAAAPQPWEAPHA